MKEISPQITMDEKIQFGKPVITGTRVPVEVVIGHIAAGDPIEAVMKEYGLTKAQVLAALKYAAKLVGEEMLIAR
ncbi:MAG: hypothetical protein UW71_C0025G0003 [Parcubacteria group bacterium GW2011_GWB1_44_7]|nr:MAG: hypothetical protein UW71_C0025G0003 [Parcubacteria group bacterium GW2011_GWB1_44_7]